MRGAWLVVVVGLLAGVFGCGGSDAPRTGNLAVTVAWPARGRQAVAGGCLVEAVVQGMTARSGWITEPGTTLTLTDVPAGSVLVRAKAFPGADAGGTLLASAATTVTLPVKQTVEAVLALVAVPAPVTEATYTLGGSVTPDPLQPDRVRINLSSVLDTTSGESIPGLDATNFLVFADGVPCADVQVVAQEMPSNKADIAFAIDTTESMDAAIGGVRDGVLGFVLPLIAADVDVRLGGIAFGDELREFTPFTTPAAFQFWVKGLYAYRGADTPENDLDAVMELLHTLDWRSDAQRVIVVVTNSAAHQRGDGTAFAHYTQAEVANVLDGEYVLHAISPGPVCETWAQWEPGRRSGGQGSAASPTGTRGGIGYVDMQRLAYRTGGTWTAFPDDGVLDLPALPVGDAIIAKYVLSFPAARYNVAHDIRLLVLRDGVPVAEQQFSGTY